MGRLIEETELEKYIMHDGCEKGCGYIDERDLKYIPTAEAISKDQYEVRLKADLVAILTGLSMEIGEIEDGYVEFDEEEQKSLTMIPLESVDRLIQQKINSIKAESEVENGND